MSTDHNLDVFDDKRGAKSRKKPPLYILILFWCFVLTVLLVAVNLMKPDMPAHHHDESASLTAAAEAVARKPAANAGTIVSTTAAIEKYGLIPEPQAEKSRGATRAFEDNFDKGLLRQWEPTDETAWAMVVDGTRHVYALTKVSEYKPAVRSPLSYSLVRDVTVGAFVMTADLKSAGPPGGHQDLCLFFGYKDPSHYYYVHLGKEADLHANSVFIVDGTARATIATYRTDGTPWDDGYHKVKLIRKLNPPTIEVYWDDSTEPVMTATNGVFTHGRVGIGSFDNMGFFDNFTVWSLNSEH